MRTVFVALVLVSALASGCGASVRPTVQTSDAATVMERVCARASLRERLGLRGVRTEAGTFYCGTSL